MAKEENNHVFPVSVHSLGICSNTINSFQEQNSKDKCLFQEEHSPFGVRYWN